MTGSLARAGMLTVILPWPDSRLSPNARSHWAPKSAIKKRERQAAQIETRNQVAENWRIILSHMDDIPLEIYFCPPDKRHRDIDNMLASCKAQLDGLADALGVNDTTFEPITLHRGKIIEGGQVIIYIGGNK
jgi:crossover junction endodeoxyribonuclease RusA